MRNQLAINLEQISSPDKKMLSFVSDRGLKQRNLQICNTETVHEKAKLNFSGNHDSNLIHSIDNISNLLIQK